MLTLSELLTRPWAASRDMMGVVERSAGAIPVDCDGSADNVILNLFGTLKPREPKLMVQDGVAIIPITGGLSNRWGQTSYPQIIEQAEAAMNDPAVKAVMLDVDSPGGNVTGVKEAGDALFELAKAKPVYTFSSTMNDSAAFWLSSCARERAGTATSEWGSIAVRTLHVDWSGWNEKQGLAYTHLATGEFKVMGNEDEPLNEKAKAYIMEQLDPVHEVFVADVARNMGISKSEAEALASGRVWVGRHAVEAGVCSRIVESRESYLGEIIKSVGGFMDINELQASHPGVYEAVFTAGKKEAGANQGVAVNAETERVLAIAGSVLGADAKEKLAGVVNTGASADQVAALVGAIGPAEIKAPEAGAGKQTKEAILENLQKAHSDGVTPDAGKQPGEDTQTEATRLAEMVD